MTVDFNNKLKELSESYEQLIKAENHALANDNGIYTRYQNPVLTNKHVPYFWKYDLSEATNPFLMERIGINAVFNAGAMKYKDKFILAARVEGNDRKSFFAIAESANGTDGFRFWDKPISFKQRSAEETNVYDMRLVQHEDGWIYGLFCTEKRDPDAPAGDQSAAIAQCGIIRTKDLLNWDRLADLKTPSPQQRNVVLHPEFVNGKYAFYTRPQDSFIEAGKGGGIGFGLADTIEEAIVNEEIVIDPKVYHTVYEAKNGLGPAPIKTSKGWLHLAHGVRNTAAGLRYVLYVFLTDLSDLTKVIYKPSGYFLAPEGEERIGDVSNVVFSNGWVADEDGQVFIYYASSDTRMHVAVSTVDKLLDYVLHSPADKFTSDAAVANICNLVDKNQEIKKYDTYMPMNG